MIAWSYYTWVKSATYPLLPSWLSTSRTLSRPLYCTPVTRPPGFDNVTCSMPLSITTWIQMIVNRKFQFTCLICMNLGRNQLWGKYSNIDQLCWSYHVKDPMWLDNTTKNTTSKKRRRKTVEVTWWSWIHNRTPLHDIGPSPSWWSPGWTTTVFLIKTVLLLF